MEYSFVAKVKLIIYNVSLLKAFFTYVHTVHHLKYVLYMYCILTVSTNSPVNFHAARFLYQLCSFTVSLSFCD